MEAALDNYIRAKQEYIAIDSMQSSINMSMSISSLLASQDQNLNTHKKYDDEVLAYVQTSKDIKFNARCYSHLAMVNFENEEISTAIKYYKKALAIHKKVKDKLEETNISNNIAVLYSENLDMPDSALYYLNKNLPELKNRNEPLALYYNYSNQAAAYFRKGQYQKSIDILNYAEKLPVDPIMKINFLNSDLMTANYEALHDYKNAYKYLSLTKKITDSINITQQNIALNEIQTKYETTEKDLENTVLKNNLKVQAILIYSFVALLIIAVFVGFLIVKNARKREKISEQDKLIEQQKFDKALKDYELSSIDIMLEGQEKERQRIANDLHDNLGSMLATLKLNFENLRLRKDELRNEENKLYDRTDELIEEAYQKVRRIAHAKNAGVFASEGLIPAITKLAEKISIPGKLSLQVIPFGFKDRLDNTIEISIFRVVQELATNIIKHSHATEATIHLTHHDDNINIIIEDNGVGFDQKTLSGADGMGLTSIRKKVTQLGGTFTIDATPGKGTTIIIDLPV
ncbi:tetratricopeptide repeat-containing sensor histidine kinase [Flavobacterium zepuense]|nr:sensor histidine kinase [Flavobacterium zepuense]